MVPSKSDLRILMVDDDEDDYILIRDMVRDLYQGKAVLDWVENYPDAIAQLEQRLHDVYLIDYRLGAYNGLEILAKYSRQVNSAPIILLTGQDDPELDKEAMKFGAADYLVKGNFGLAQLEKTIRYSLNNARHLSQIALLNQELEKRVVERTKELEIANFNLRNQIVETERTRKALAESQSMLQAMAHNFPDGSIAILDKELKFIFIDGLELEALNLDKDEMVGQSFLNFFSGDVVENMKLWLSKVWLGEHVWFEAPYMERFYQFNVVPLPAQDSSAAIPYILLVATNITRQKQAENDILKALQKERELNEMKSRFVTMASHEFRTPLATILSSTSLIGRYVNSEDQEKREKHIGRIKTAVAHMTQTIEDFISFGKLEEGIVKAELRDIDLMALFKEVIEELQSTAKDGQMIKANYGFLPAVFLSDSGFLRNILNNLLSNAIKYSKENSEVEFSAWMDENSDLRITVKDNGIGIPEEDQKHLFTRFFRAGNAANIKGTGLGLNICKKYVDLLKGSIEFSSIQGEGTTFTLLLPNRANSNTE